MHDETELAFADVLGRRNDGFIQMTLVSGDNRRDRAHMEDLAQRSRRPLLFNAVSVFDTRPHIHRSALKWLESCRQRGIRVYGQGLTTDAGFAFTFEDWNLFDDSQPWCEATTGTIEEKMAKMSDPEHRQRMKEKIPFTATGPVTGIVVTGPKSAENQQWLDHTIELVAEKTGKHPVDALLDIALADRLETEFFVAPPNTDPELLREIVDNPFVLFGVSDGGAHTKFLTAGRYPTETIERMVRKHQMCSLEHAHWRLSALPAMIAGFPNRGVIQKGAAADIVIYDYENLKVLPDEIAHDYPGGEWRRVQRAQGYRWILVNGTPIIENDQEVGAHPGKLLRHGTGTRRPHAIAAE
jgi:N-acyl-D-aspartate/D-glutamate deacylase